MACRVRSGAAAAVVAIVATVLVPAQQAFAAGAKADFDGDGRGDLAVGVPGEDVGGFDNAGGVNVLYGTRYGLRAAGDQFFHQNNLEDAPEADDAFGSAVATGDFDGDGYSDLAVGAPGEAELLAASHGAVHVIYGSSDGLSVAAGEDFFMEDSVGLDASEAGDRFGAALVAGDFNDDGFGDLGIAHPGETVGSADQAGAVTVLNGSADGLTTEGAQLWSQDSAGIDDTAESGDHFGAALARRDFDGDGIADIAIGVPDETLGSNSGAGALNVVYGTDEGFAATGSQLIHQNVDGVRDTAEPDDTFGEALATGDFDGDGFGDLAVGVPGESIGSGGTPSNGAVGVFFGSGSGIDVEEDQFLHQNIDGIPSSAGEDERFGAALAAGDFDGNGRDDLAIGVPGERVRRANGVTVHAAGAVHVLYGRAGGIKVTGDDWWHQALKSILGGSQQDDHFGSALVARNFGRGARADLAIGVPDEDSGPSTDEIADSGRVHVLYGVSGGLTAEDDQAWEQETSGVNDDAEDGDRFGATLG